MLSISGQCLAPGSWVGRVGKGYFSSWEQHVHTFTWGITGATALGTCEQRNMAGQVPSVLDRPSCEIKEFSFLFLISSVFPISKMYSSPPLSFFLVRAWSLFVIPITSTISPSLDLSGIKATHTPPTPQVCSLMLFTSILACSQTYDIHLLTQRLGLSGCVMYLNNFLEGDSNIYPGVGNHLHNVRGHGLRD